MKKILNIMQSVDLDSKSQKIINGEMQQGLIMGKVCEFNRLDAIEQNAFRYKLMERVKKITKPYKLITVLLLVDQLMKTSNNFDLPEFSFLSLRQKDSKECIILMNMLKYYHYFLKLNDMNKYNKYVTNVEDQLGEAQNYCEMAIAKILEFTKNDFIFSNAWLKVQEHRVLFRQIMGSILERFREDLHIVNSFVKGNIDKVMQDNHPLAFHINFVYEKLILINRQMKKIEKIIRLYDLQIQLPTYQFDKELNTKVQMAMLERKEERRQFEVERIKKMNTDTVERRNQIYGSCELDDININMKTNQNFLLLEDEEDL